MAETKYWVASEVKDIADALIMAHHDHLSNEPFRYIFKKEASKKNGKVVLGTASVIAGRSAFLALDLDEWDREAERQEAPSFFLIEIAKDEWDKLDDTKKQALVDHELSHCWAQDVEKGKGENARVVRSLTIKGHDIEEFGHIVERYGLWRDELQSFAKVCHEHIVQHSLFDAGMRDRLATGEYQPEPDAEEQHVQVQTGGRGRKK